MNPKFEPIAGFHDDGWLELVSTVGIQSVKSILLRLFLPRRKDSQGKEISIFFGNQKIASQKILRGEISTMQIELPQEKRSGTIRLEFEYAEPVDGDLRQLGCILVEKTLASLTPDETADAAGNRQQQADATVFGYLQAVQKSVVRGWIASKDVDREIPLVDLIINGQTVHRSLRCNKRREDVEKKHADCGVWGFEIPLEAGALDQDVNEVRVVECGTREDLSGSPRTAPGNYELKLRGAVDLPKFGVLISGWAAYAPPVRPVNLVVSIDGNEIGSVRAVSYRRDLDLKQIGPGGRAAFEIMAPAKYIDGKTHSVSIMEAESRKPIAHRSEVRFSQNKDYHDYQAFTHWAYFYREMYAPFTESDKRVLAHCDWQKQYYSEAASKIDNGPKFSIVMPTYNRAKTIRTAIDSVLAQSYKNFELIVVDDGGSDETEDVVALYQDPRIFFIKKKRNEGVSAARNTALSRSLGQFVAYLDSDNFWDPDFISVMLTQLLSNQSFDAAYCGQYLYRGSSNLPYAVRLGPFASSLMENRNYLDLNAFVHRRTLYENLGGFDEGLRRLVDWDLILRYTRTKKPLFVPCVLSHYIFKNSGDSITDKEDYNLALTRFDEKNLGTMEVDVGAELNSDEKDMHLRPRLFEATSRKSQRAPVSVLIPSYNIPDILSLSVRRLLLTMDPEDQIIIVDNGSTAETKRTLSKLAKDDSRVQAIRNEVNEGFSKAINQGAEVASPSNDLIIFNNDAIPFGDWIGALSNCLHSCNSIGAVVPQQVLLPRTQTILNHVPFANPNREVDVNVSWHHRNIHDLRIEDPLHDIDLEFAPFFCVMVKRSIFDEIGGLDERLGAHYRSDRNFCNALRHTLRKRLVYVHEAKVYHLLQRSTRDLMVGSKGEFDRVFVRNTLRDNPEHQRPIWDLVDE